MKKSIFFAAAALLALASCQDDYENVAENNRIYDTTVDRVNLNLLDGKYDSFSRTLGVSIAQPVDQNVTVTYDVTPENLEAYKAIYGGEPILLPSENYSIPEKTAVIEAGAMQSTRINIDFTGINSLDDQKVYVLPVSVVSSSVPMIESQKTTYFVFRGAALINWAAGTTNTCLTFVNEGQCPELGNLQKMTVEFLINPDAFDNQLSTIIGIEGNFLIRIGDAGVPSNQIQLAASSNVTSPDWQLEIGKWTFVTMTYDGTNGDVEVFFNGVSKGKVASSNRRTVNWNVASSDRACYVGYAYDVDRDFEGKWAQLRVWNRILTADELMERNHFYRVDNDAEGLVLYLKFDEGAGNLVHDYANGYDMQVPATYPGKSSTPDPLGWFPVSLPE